MSANVLAGQMIQETAMDIREAFERAANFPQAKIYSKKASLRAANFDDPF